MQPTSNDATQDEAAASTHRFDGIEALAFVIASAALIAGCGGAAAPQRASEPSAAREPEPTTVEEAQAQIAHARAELGGATPDGEAQADSAAPAPKKPAATKPTGGAEAETESTASQCASSCRAIASMRRAVGALCRMTGDEDARCVEAKRTLEESEARVSSCGCGP